MTAIAEPALMGKGGDVGKGDVEAVIGGPQMEFPEARGIDDEAAVGEEDEFAGGGGVATLGVPFTDREGGLDAFAVEAVDKAGFSNAGRAEDDGGGAGGEEFPEAGEGATGAGADDEDGMPAGDAADFVGDGIGIGAEIGLVEDDDGLGAAFVDHHEEPFEAAMIDGFAEGLDHEGEIDVGGQDLNGGLASGDLAGDLGPAGQDAFDGNAVGGFGDSDADPVTNFGKLAGM